MSGFVKRWLQREAGDPVQPWLPEGNRLYCIGDIHGRLDLLGQLQQRIRADAAAFTGVLTLVYLGDYIDRGPHSRGVIDCLLEQVGAFRFPASKEATKFSMPVTFKARKGAPALNRD